MLKLVPFNPAWTDHAKLDMKAMYRRPRYQSDDWGEPVRERDAEGVPTWDIVGPLPLKQHNAWIKKGFEYVTLANRDSLFMAAKTGTLPEGHTFKDYDQHMTGGPWHARKYHEGRHEVDRAALDQLRADIAKYGPEAVEAIRRQTDPTFALPPELKDVKKSKREAVTA